MSDTEEDRDSEDSDNAEGEGLGKLEVSGHFMLQIKHTCFVLYWSQTQCSLLLEVCLCQLQ
jgi:hypothetical protein